MDPIRWIDDHCHPDPDPAVAAGQVAAAAAAGVTRLVAVGCDVAQSAAYVELARTHPGVVFAAAGVHPHESSRGLDGLEEILTEGGVVAVGECGLDYHYDHSPRAVQREAFGAQVELAHRHGLALVIHTRSAWDDTFAVLGDHGVPPRTVFHCFSGGPARLDRCLEVGAFVSFSGIVTFASAGDVREAAARCPLDRVLVETDSPYLAPVPHRGRLNEPALVPLVGEAVASASGLPVGEVAAAVWSNAERVYGIEAT